MSRAGARRWTVYADDVAEADSSVLPLESSPVSGRASSRSLTRSSSFNTSGRGRAIALDWDIGRTIGKGMSKLTMHVCRSCFERVNALTRDNSCPFCCGGNGTFQPVRLLTFADGEVRLARHRRKFEVAAVKIMHKQDHRPRVRCRDTSCSPRAGRFCAITATDCFETHDRQSNEKSHFSRRQCIHMLSISTTCTSLIMHCKASSFRFEARESPECLTITGTLSYQLHCVGILLKRGTLSSCVQS